MSKLKGVKTTLYAGVIKVLYSVVDPSPICTPTVPCEKAVSDDINRRILSKYLFIANILQNMCHINTHKIGNA